MDGVPDREPVRDARGRFGPGNPGRPYGSRNKMTTALALNMLSLCVEQEERAKRLVQALRRLEAGEGSMADVEAALLGKSGSKRPRRIR